MFHPMFAKYWEKNQTNHVRLPEMKTEAQNARFAAHDCQQKRRSKAIENDIGIEFKLDFFFRPFASLLWTHQDALK